MHLWSEENNLYLLTPSELAQLPQGTKLECIDGTLVIYGQDHIDLDTRFGYLAYGIRDPFEHALKHLFLTFVIKGA